MPAAVINQILPKIGGPWEREGSMISHNITFGVAKVVWMGGYWVLLLLVLLLGTTTTGTTTI